MSSISQLGRAFNATSSVTTTARRVSLKDYSGCGFLVVGASAATPVTISESTAQTGGTRQTIPGLASFVYYTMANGAGTWTLGAGAPTTIANAAALLYVWVPQGALSDGFSYLDASHATGTIVYLLGDVDVQRRPTLLRSVDA